MIIAGQSLAAHTDLGQTMVASSREAGWTSLLLDRHVVPLDGARIETRATPDQTVVVQFTGEQSIEVFDGGRWRPATYQSGTVGLTPGGHVDRIRRQRAAKVGWFGKLNLYIPVETMQATWEALRASGQRTPAPMLNSLAFADPMVWHTAAALDRAMSDEVPDLYAQSAAQWLAAHLFTCHSKRGAPSAMQAREAITDARLARTLEMMSARLTEPLTLDALAAEAGISRFHFVRHFRERTGRTPFATLQAMRIEAAQTLLVATDLDLGTIAFRCGFTSAKALSHAFKRALHVAPGQWRASRRA